MRTATITFKNGLDKVVPAALLDVTNTVVLVLYGDDQRAVELWPWTSVIGIRYDDDQPTT